MNGDRAFSARAFLRDRQAVLVHFSTVMASRLDFIRDWSSGYRWASLDAKVWIEHSVSFCIKREHFVFASKCSD